MSTHYVMSGGWWPTAGITLPHAEGLGGHSCPIRFDMLVDKLSQEILHQRSTAALLEACCSAVGAKPTDEDHHGPRGRSSGTSRAC